MGRSKLVGQYFGLVAKEYRRWRPSGKSLEKCRDGIPGFYRAVSNGGQSQARYHIQIFNRAQNTCNWAFGRTKKLLAAIRGDVRKQ